MNGLNCTRFALFFAAFHLLLGVEERLSAVEESTSTAITFYQHVHPILQNNCIGCHGGEKPKGRLNLETLASLLKGGEEGASVVPGASEESLLYLLVSGEEKPRMPPKREDALTDEDVKTLKLWIDGGALPGEAIVEVPYSSSRPLNAPVYQRPPVISALAYSNDGKRIFVSGYQEVLVHEAEPPGGAPATPLARWVGEAERIHALAVSPDGRFVAAVGGSPVRYGELQIWNVETCNLMSFARIGRDTLFAVTFSPDGKRVAVGGTDRSLHIVDAETAEELYSSEVHSDWIFAVAFIDEGSRIVSSGRDKTLKVCDASDGGAVKTLAILEQSVLTVVPQPGTSEVFVAGEIKNPLLYNHEKRSMGGTFEEQPGVVLAGTFTQDGKLIALGGAGGEVRVYTVGNRKRIATFTGHKGWIYALAFRPDGERLAVAGYEGVVRIYSLSDKKEVRSFVPVPLGEEWHSF